MSSSPRRYKTLAVVLGGGALMVAGYQLRGDRLAEMTFENRPATTRFDAGDGALSLRSEVEMALAEGPREEDLPRLAFDVVVQPVGGGQPLTMSCDATPGVPTFAKAQRHDEEVDVAAWRRPLEDCPLTLSPGPYELTVTPRWTHRGRDGDVLIGCELVVVAD